MGNQKDGEWPENRAFSSLAPLAGDTELTETTKPEAKAQLVASQPRHGHHHITMKPTSPGHWHPSQEGMGEILSLESRMYTHLPALSRWLCTSE